MGGRRQRRRALPGMAHDKCLPCMLLHLKCTFFLGCPSAAHPPERIIGKSLAGGRRPCRRRCCCRGRCRCRCRCRRELKAAGMNPNAAIQRPCSLSSPFSTRKGAHTRHRSQAALGQTHLAPKLLFVTSISSVAGERFAEEARTAAGGARGCRPPPPPRLVACHSTIRVLLLLCPFVGCSLAAQLYCRKKMGQWLSTSSAAVASTGRAPRRRSRNAAPEPAAWQLSIQDLPDSLLGHIMALAALGQSPRDMQAVVGPARRGAVAGIHLSACFSVPLFPVAGGLGDA